MTTLSGTMRAISARETAVNYQAELLKVIRAAIEDAGKSGRIRPLSGAELDELDTRFRAVTYDALANLMLVTVEAVRPKPPVDPSKP